jgi:hypothetical protein
VGPTGTKVTNNRRVAGLAVAGLAAVLTAFLLSGCSSDSAFPAVHDMPAARTETKLTPDQIKQATDDLISQRDKTEANAQSNAQPVTTGSVPPKKSAASAQPAAAQQSSSGINAYAKQ